jgi:hypothetical protein
MSGNPAPAANPPDAQPGYFGEPARPRFGWLHRPASSVADVGLVIVPPFGFEAVCAHRSLRHLAQAAAASERISAAGMAGAAGFTWNERGAARAAA